MRLTQILFARMGEWSKQYANLPDRYIKRAMEQVYWRNPKGPQYRKDVVIKRKKYTFEMHRPWEREFYELNAPGRYHPKVFVEPIRKWGFFRGDRVEVLVGKDKGKQGIVKQIIQERNWVIVEGLNTELKRVGREGDEFFYIRAEKPLLVTDQVALIDPSDLKSTPIEWRFTEDGQEVRVSKRTGRIIPVPSAMQETIDYKSKATYLEQPKDTKADVVTDVTFKPSLRTFEMDVMAEMGIQEERIPPKTYWY